MMTEPQEVPITLVFKDGSDKLKKDAAGTMREHYGRSVVQTAKGMSDAAGNRLMILICQPEGQRALDSQACAALSDALHHLSGMFAVAATGAAQREKNEAFTQ